MILETCPKSIIAGVVAMDMYKGNSVIYLYKLKWRCRSTVKIGINTYIKYEFPLPMLLRAWVIFVL